MEEQTTKGTLNEKQELFCKIYTGDDRELYGNGTQSYLEVYGYEDENGKAVSYVSAMAAASRLLRNVKICNRINELLETGGFNDQNVDKQHLFLINQHADLKSKLGAIKEYNALKKRVENKLELILPQPILSNVQNNHSNEKDNVDDETDQGDSGGNECVENNLGASILDTLSPKR